MSRAERSDSITGESSTQHRRERIAAQACETCRSRKSKCDEQRPKCSLCQRLGIDCVYREPLPTKKDKTLVHILDALTRIENKFDNFTLPPPQSHASTTTSFTNERHQPSERSTSSFTNAQRIYTWPSVHLHLINTRPESALTLQAILQRGGAWFVEQDTIRPSALSGTVHGLENEPFKKDGNPTIILFPSLNIQQVNAYMEAYFHTFNVVAPILEQDSFTDEVVTPLLRGGYAYTDTRSVLALLVYALGQLALEGTLGEPITTFENGRISGIRGGTDIRPPGIEIFNEARRRLSMISSHGTIQSVQIHLLAAMYYAANASHLDYWKSIHCTAAALEIFIRCNSIDLHSPEAENIRQLYWVCQVNESICRYDLDMPIPGISEHLKSMPLPTNRAQKQPGGIASTTAEERPQHQCYFPALVELDHLIAEIFATIIDPSAAQSATSAPFSGPAIPVVRDLARQLESWRSLLPRSLQWLDSGMYDFPRNDISARPLDALFSLDQGTVPIRHRYNLDIMTAHLRSRFYYARHLLYQPFIYKALHFSELLTEDDVGCVTLGIKAACSWPVLMAPAKDKKRLIPHLVSWSQIFISVILLLEMTRAHEVLMKICETHVSQQQIQQTISLMMDWLSDIKQIDSLADRGCQILKPLFSKR